MFSKFKNDVHAKSVRHLPSTVNHFDTSPVVPEFKNFLRTGCVNSSLRLSLELNTKPPRKYVKFNAAQRTQSDPLGVVTLCIADLRLRFNTEKWQRRRRRGPLTRQRI